MADGRFRKWLQGLKSDPASAPKRADAGDLPDMTMGPDLEIRLKQFRDEITELNPSQKEVKNEN